MSLTEHTNALRKHIRILQGKLKEDLPEDEQAINRELLRVIQLAIKTDVSSQSIRAVIDAMEASPIDGLFDKCIEAAQKSLLQVSLNEIANPHGYQVKCHFPDGSRAAELFSQNKKEVA